MQANFVERKLVTAVKAMIQYSVFETGFDWLKERSLVNFY